MDAQLVALSYLISWLGAYTSTQIMIHAKYTRRVPLRWMWTFFASFAFGFCSIWAMHFGEYLLLFYDFSPLLDLEPALARCFATGAAHLASVRVIAGLLVFRSRLLHKRLCLPIFSLSVKILNLHGCV